MGVAGELLMGDRGEERAVGSAAERDDDAAEPAQLAPQRFDLGVDPMSIAVWGTVPTLAAPAPDGVGPQFGCPGT